MNETGTLAWFDFATKDEAKAMAFYKTVFGWKFNPASEGYWMVQAGEKTIGGLRRESARDFRAVAGFVPYLAVPSVKEASQLIEKNGGTLIGGHMNIGEHGFFQLFQDPESNQMAVWSMKP